MIFGFGSTVPCLTKYSPLSSNPSLEFVAAPALKPAEVQVDPELMQQYQRELAEVCVYYSARHIVILKTILSRPRLFLFPRRTTTCKSLAPHELFPALSLARHLFVVHSL